MILIVEERQSVLDCYANWFNREGVSAAGLCPSNFEKWVQTVSEPDLFAIEAFLLGECGERNGLPKIIKGRTNAAVIALNDHKSLDQTLELFAAGVDDVVRKPVHVREIMARVKAIQRRVKKESEDVAARDIRVFSDGRDPEVKGDVLALPRRERRVLEYLIGHQGRWVTKTQIFNSVYGLFSEDIDENVVESHISKLRKRLRNRLGYDPIESQRYVGYRLVHA